MNKVLALVCRDSGHGNEKFKDGLVLSHELLEVGLHISQRPRRREGKELGEPEMIKYNPNHNQVFAELISSQK